MAALKYCVWKGGRLPAAGGRFEFYQSGHHSCNICVLPSPPVANWVNVNVCYWRCSHWWQESCICVCSSWKKLIARMMTTWQRYYSCKITISNSNHDKSSNPIHITFFGILKWCKIALFPFTFLNGVDVSQFETVLWIKRAQGGTMTIWDRPQLLSPFSVHLSPSINIPRTHIVVQLGPIKRKNEYSVQHNRKWKQRHEIWFSSSWSKCHVPESKSHIAVQRRPV